VDKERPLPREVELPQRVREVRLEFIHPEVSAPLSLEEGFNAGQDDSGRWVMERTPIAHCVNCGRWVDDPTRTVFDSMMPDHLFDSEVSKEPVCSECQAEDLGRALEEDILLLLERKLGLAERHRDALKLFIETIFTDPQKILQMQDLNNRVRELEKQTNLLWMVYVSAILALLVALASLVVSVVT
jgi:hypothetical protein